MVIAGREHLASGKEWLLYAFPGLKLVSVWVYIFVYAVVLQEYCK